MQCGSTSLGKYCVPTVVHGANMGSGGAAGGRSPLDHKEYEAIVDEDEDDSYELDCYVIRVDC